jgi:sulfoxide reductase heme-binding subunit YedZ
MILAAVGTTDPSDHLYWLTSRAAGTAAMLFASAAMLVGAMRAAGLAGADVHGNRRRLELGIVHEMLGLACIVALLIHGLVLLGDAYMNPSFADLAIPFYGPYEETFNGIGIVSGYVFMLFSLTYYVRDRVGEGRWTVVHRLTVLAWAGSIIHTLGLGTDKDQVWFRAVLFLPAIAALALLAWRVFGRSRVQQPAA